MFAGMPTITPRLIVKSVPDAIAFYTEVFGAHEHHRFASPAGIVVHAAITIGDAVVSLAQEVRDWRLLSPSSVGGSPVLLTLECDDPDAVCARAFAHGAQVLIPVADQLYGHREGRIEDPMGHLWILSKVIEKLDDAEIRRRMESFRG